MLGCSKGDDSVETPLLEGQNFFAKVNGSSFVSGAPFVGASYQIVSGVSALSIIATNTNQLNNGEAMAILFSSYEENFELKSGQVFTIDNENIILGGTYGKYPEDDDFELDEVATMRLEITKIDIVNKLLSGKFNFTVRLINSNNITKTYTVTEGVFEDVAYQSN